MEYYPQYSEKCTLQSLRNLFADDSRHSLSVTPVFEDAGERIFRFCRACIRLGCKSDAQGAGFTIRLPVLCGPCPSDASEGEAVENAALSRKRLHSS